MREREKEGETLLQFTPVQWAQDTCFAPDVDATVASAAAAAALLRLSLLSATCD